jgi:hypothetical protein
VLCFLFVFVASSRCIDFVGVWRCEFAVFGWLRLWLLFVQYQRVCFLCWSLVVGMRMVVYALLLCGRCVRVLLLGLGASGEMIKAT